MSRKKPARQASGSGARSGSGRRRTARRTTGRRGSAGRVRPWRRWVLWGTLLVVVGFAGWLAWLDARITREFEGRRWDQPAQVFAAPVDLYAGRSLGIERFVELLEAQGYRQADGSAPRAGFWWRQGSSIRLMTRAFRFAEDAQPAQVAQIDFGAAGINRIRDAEGRDLPFLQLDPMRIGSIFPAHGEDRMVLAPEEIPRLLASALIAVEDRRFERHHGLDPEGIGRALLVNLRAGEVRQGGSTLTQQLVKSYFLDSRRTLRRKFTEAAMALLLERRYPKDEILTAYVNEVYMGQDGRRAIHGFGLASAFYFGKPLSELDYAEIATLVTIVRGPSFYNPQRHPERVRERRDRVLAMLAEQGVIDPDRAEEAATRPLGLRGAAVAGPSYQPAFLGLVRRQLRRDYRDTDLDSAGLVVLTTLDPLAQRSAQAAVSEGIGQLRKRGEALATVEGAAVVTRPATGEVLALVGGAHGSFDGLNRALDASRPIGSLVKPMTYLAALESGRYTLATTLHDEAVTVNLEDGSTWQPENFSGAPLGPVSMARSLAESLNLAAVNLGLALGVDAVAQRLGRLAGGSSPPAFPSLLLGSVDYAPLDVAGIYGAIAAGGFRAPLLAVKAVLDETGAPLSRYPLEIEAVADPLAVAQLQRGLELVFERGTARSVAGRLGGRRYAGKTGTSGEFRDSWFAGFGGDTLAVVWVGRDDNAPVGLTGAGGALPIWADIMADLNTTGLAPAASTGLVEVEIDYVTGLLARGDCADTVVVPVPEGAALDSMRGCAPWNSGEETPLERGLQWLKRALGGK